MFGEERGAGGKIVRKRRRELAAPPYDRPENSVTAAAVAAENGNPKWFSGIFSGAGRLISSVFRSESEDSSSNSSSDAEDDDDDNGNAAEDFLEQDERSNKALALCGAEETQWSERKLAIKQILSEETFSRNESDELIKIIQSRVIDTSEDVKSSERRRISDKSVYNDLTFLGTWRSINKGRKFPDGLSYSSEESPVLGHAQDICQKAVMEAKQWLDKKKLESASKSGSDVGPCKLNTAVWDVQAGSPVDVARTYMRSRPPWQSPTFTGFRFRSPSTGTLLFKDETPSSVKSDMVSSPSLGLGSIPLPSCDQGSKPVHTPTTPEYGCADVALTSPDQGAVNLNISIPLSIMEGGKRVDVGPVGGSKEFVDHSSNGAVDAQGNICSTNYIPDPDQLFNGEDFKMEGRDQSAVESPSSSVPNFVLVNDPNQGSEAVKTTDSKFPGSDTSRRRRRLNQRSSMINGSPPRPSSELSGPLVTAATDSSRRSSAPRSRGGTSKKTSDQTARSGRGKRGGLVAKAGRGRGSGK